MSGPIFGSKGGLSASEATRCLAGQYVGLSPLEMLPPDLKHYKVRLNFPSRGKAEDLGGERGNHHQLLGEQPSSSPCSLHLTTAGGRAS